jgi:hypothetical protein
MFHLFQKNVASVLSECCKCRSGCCINMHVVSICFKCFICIFVSVSSECCICLQLFSNVFASVSYACFKCFICLLLYVVTIVSGCFKNRSGVVHRMRVGSGGRSGRRGWGGAGPLLVHSLASPTRYTLVCSLYAVTTESFKRTSGC